MTTTKNPIGGRLSNRDLPGYRALRLTGPDTIPGSTDTRRIYDPDGNPIGRIVYIAEKRPGVGTTYGWLPEPVWTPLGWRTFSKPRTLVEAVRLLIARHEALTQ